MFAKEQVDPYSWPGTRKMQLVVTKAAAAAGIAIAAASLRFTLPAYVLRIARGR